MKLVQVFAATGCLWVASVTLRVIVARSCDLRREALGSSPAGPTATSKTRLLRSCYATPGVVWCLVSETSALEIASHQLSYWARIIHSAVKTGLLPPSTSTVTSEVTCTAVSRRCTVLVSERARTLDPISTGSPKRIDSNP